MRSLFLVVLLGSVGVWAQSSNPSTPSQAADSSSSKVSPSSRVSLDPPRADRVSADALPDGQSSSKDSQIDLSAPDDDAKAHPRSSEILMDAETSPDSADVSEFHPWDPHKSAKDVEVGDYYFRRKNYTGAESRYREALYYKDNDATATYRLAICLEKLNRPEDALAEYESYLKILPHGPEAGEVQKAINRLKAADSSAKAAK